ncbi:N-acetyltryptophan 6-hydroxylase ivoC [Cladobotryum mycophilum]|uniref:N-acetyltryptophan 6-hydroxylase ivoC n=1 Tax=Cladobotryum mycophilum TaxID=491253 RepID=A0ABR0SB86_9HYPO
MDVHPLKLSCVDGNGMDRHPALGPLIRINPDELHCSDPEFLNEVYAGGQRPRNKSQHWISGFPSNLHTATVFTIDHDTHRSRRSAFIKFFSRMRTSRLQGVVHQTAQKLCDKMLGYKEQGPFETMKAYSCFTTDIISEYCFGRSTAFLDQPGWDSNYLSSVNSVGQMIHMLRQFPLLGHFLHRMPLLLLRMFSPYLWRTMNEMTVVMPNEIDQLKKISSAEMEKERTTVFLSMLQSDLPASEKDTDRLAAEAQTLFLGGTDTTAATLNSVTYHLLDNPDIYNKLRAELLTEVADATSLPAWEVLEKLPYLSAVILEGLRHVYGSVSRLPRTATEEDLVYQGSWRPSPTAAPIEVKHVIPRGYAVGMSTFMIHGDETIFPTASQFIPERWLGENNKRRRDLENYLLSFSKGSRQCLGMQLAYCMLYLCITAVVLRVLPHMALFATAKEDVEYDHDELMAHPKRGSKGIRVIL